MRVIKAWTVFGFQSFPFSAASTWCPFSLVTLTSPGSLPGRFQGNTSPGSGCLRCILRVSPGIRRYKRQDAVFRLCRPLHDRQVFLLDVGGRLLRLGGWWRLEPLVAA